MIDVFDVPLSKSMKIVVKANQRQNKILSYNQETKVFKVAIKAIPENDKANIEVIKFFSKMLGKPVRIKTGFTSKEKLIVFD